jgi:ApaG protein
VKQASTESVSPYAATTRNITVSVQPYFLDDQSVPDASHFVWPITSEFKIMAAKLFSC